MIRLVLGAVRSRSAQAIAVAVLTVLAVGAAVASPWYVLAAERAAATSDVSSASAAVKTVSVRQILALTAGPRAALDGFRTTAEQGLNLPGLTPVMGLSRTVDAGSGVSPITLPLAYRDGVCAHVMLTGTCPSTAGQVMLTAHTAAMFGVHVGDPLPLRPAPGGATPALVVSGIYATADPLGPYWADTTFGVATSQLQGTSQVADSAFVVLDTFAAPALNNATAVYDATLPESMLRGDNGFDLDDRLARADYQLRPLGSNLATQAQLLTAVVRADRDSIGVGVLVGGAQLLVLCWFALYLAGRYTARGRRHDVALLKLRGATRFAVLRVVLGQSAVPMVVGLLIGAPAGYLAARLAAGPVTESDQVRLAAVLSGAAALGAVVGALVALALSELRALRAPVAELLRRVPQHRRGLRADLTDLAIVAVAAAAVYQVRSQGTGGAVGPGLAVLAPGLVALAVALIVARLLGWGADRMGTWALYTGRVRLALASLQISRRPGTDRVFALLALSVALLGTAADGWAAGVAARGERAGQDAGAARVLTVSADNNTALLSAVRAADPSGRYAMAAVYTPSGPGGTPPVLAVDASRLAAVLHHVAGTAPTPAGYAALLSGPASPRPLLVTGDTLVLHVTALGSQPVNLVATLENQATGVPVTATFVLPAPGAALGDVRAPVSGCTGTAGCRLVSLGLALAQGAGPPPRGASVTIGGLGQLNPAGTVASAADLGNPARWRGSASAHAIGVSAGNGALTIGVPPGPGFSGVEDMRAYTVDTALPVPLVVAGQVPSAWLVGDPSLQPFGGSSLPGRLAASVPVLPVLGGSGLLVDLQAAQRAVGDTGSGGVFQVWLAPDAPASLTARLTGAGLRVVATDSMAAHERLLQRQGPAATARFRLLTALVGLLLAAAALTVAAAVERRPRAGELTDLRAQGLPARAAASIGYGGYVVLVLAGVVAGLLGTVLARFIANVTLPVFIDGWSTLPVPGGLRVDALTGTAVVSLVVLGGTAWLAASPLVRAVRRADGGTR